MQKSKTFTHCILVDSSAYTCWMSPFVILGLFCRFYSNFDGKSANTVDPDQTPHNVASDLGLHCLPITLLRVPGKNGLMVLFHKWRYSVCCLHFQSTGLQRELTWRPGLIMETLPEV